MTDLQYASRHSVTTFPFRRHSVSDLQPVLAGQTVQNQVREIGINPNYWYAVAWAKDIKNVGKARIQPVQLWHEEIALYRDSAGQVQAVSDICPHKGVSLHKGEIKADRLVCPYHGWEFDAQGECVRIPYLPESQKLPRACLRVYPVRERYGIIFVFPGAPELAASTPMLEIPQYDQPEWLMVPIGASFQSHFSICNENTMDIFHGHLHKNIQGWFAPVLLKLAETTHRLTADYQISYKSILTQILGLGNRNELTTRTISVTYEYPHFINSLEGTSYVYLMRVPVSQGESRSFALFFLKIKLPRWILDPLRRGISPLLREFLFMRFLRQDIEMIESEYAHYCQDPTRRYVEVNPAIIALQRLMTKEYECFAEPSVSKNITAKILN
jgi:renierapurpurin 18,18'-hydroxylase